MSSASLAPNLFTYAPSELSQDAFLAWLLAWADERFINTAPALHQTGRHFVRTLLEWGGVALPVFRRVEVKTQQTVRVDGQRGAIDVHATIDGSAAVLIEDKVRAGRHGDQLRRYLAWARDEFEPDRVAAIYLKTYDQSSYHGVREAGFVPFGRSDLLRILKFGVEVGVKNDIYADFLAHLQGIDERVASFAHRPVAEWPVGRAGRDLWTGFFRRVQEHHPEARWGYVNNESGGFSALWWHGAEHEECSTYLQLEERTLSFRVTVPEKQRRSALRSDWHERILAAADDVDLPVRRPERFGHGRTMRVAEVEAYLCPDEQGRIDLDATLAQLTKAEAVLQRARRHAAP